MARALGARGDPRRRRAILAARRRHALLGGNGIHGRERFHQGWRSRHGSRIHAAGHGGPRRLRADRAGRAAGCRGLVPGVRRDGGHRATGAWGRRGRPALYELARQRNSLPAQRRHRAGQHETHGHPRARRRAARAAIASCRLLADRHAESRRRCVHERRCRQRRRRDPRHHRRRTRSCCGARISTRGISAPARSTTAPTARSSSTWRGR